MEEINVEKLKTLAQIEQELTNKTQELAALDVRRAALKAAISMLHKRQANIIKLLSPVELNAYLEDEAAQPK